MRSSRVSNDRDMLDTVWQSRYQGEVEVVGVKCVSAQESLILPFFPLIFYCIISRKITLGNTCN